MCMCVHGHFCLCVQCACVRVCAQCVCVFSVCVYSVLSMCFGGGYLYVSGPYVRGCVSVCACSFRESLLFKHATDAWS